MAVVMSMVWAEVTPAQYDTVRHAVGWEELALPGPSSTRPGSTPGACT